MKTLIILIISVLTFLSTFTQTIVTLQPGAEGKDSKIWSEESSTNFGNETEIKANAWTWSGEGGLERSFLEFDLSVIPQLSEVCYAKLSLFSTEPTSSQTNSQLSGSNDIYIKRVVDPWAETTVTWDFQPGASITNEVIVPPSTADYEDVLDIDVTLLVQDMVDAPSLSHGFLIQLVTEEYYRRRIFATSDSDDPSHHPKLEICYSAGVGVTEINKDNLINIYPNPVTPQSKIEFYLSGPELCELIICDITGRPIYVDQFNGVAGLNQIGLEKSIISNMKGLATVVIKSQNNKYIQKISKL